MHKRFWMITLTVLLLLCAGLSVSAAEPEAYLTVSSEEEFLAFGENCRLDSYSVGLTVKLEADLDLTGLEFSGIPVFCGTFEGGGHTVSGIEISANGSQLGLFRYLTETATVRNLTVEGTVAPQGSRSSVGGIAGENAGTVEKCTFRGSVSGGDRVGGLAGSNTGTVRNCRMEGSVQGSHFVGGIAGSNSGMIRGCENSAKINTTPQQNSVDISDITMDTIVGSEFVGTVTDIGGIAGINSGTVRKCENRGDVGYKHMGYNIGGICGSQTGYIKNCVNYGAVSGRKEVGGIVGQVEPTITLLYETDTLQILEEQLQVLSELTDRAAANGKNNTQNIRNLIAVLESHAANAEAAAGRLSVLPEDILQTDWDAVSRDIQLIRGSVAGIYDTLGVLGGAIGTAADDLERDLQAVSDQLAVVEQTLNSASENLGGTVTDVSEEDTRENQTSKVETSENYGSILADANAGGIVGAVATENDLDPEEDVTLEGAFSLNVSGQIRAVVLKCSNAGTVTVRRQNAGGIVGWQSLGLVKECVNTGDLTADAAQYLGGICGRSSGFIRDCSARCRITAAANAGGIAGSGRTVSGCRAIVTVSARERAGALLGWAEPENRQQTVMDNYFVAVQPELGAIDGISYKGVAEPLELEAFLTLPEQNRMFRTVTVTFTAEDGTEQAFTLNAGETLETVPQVPQKPGYTGRWEGLQAVSLENILFDMTFTAVYTGHDTVLESQTKRDDGRPVLLVQGDFADGGAVSVEELAQAPHLEEKETLLESWQLTLAGCEAVLEGRLAKPAEADAQQLQLYVRAAEENWQRREFRVNGSYLVFSLGEGENGIALTQLPPQVNWQLPAAVGAVAVVAALAVILAIKKKKRAAKVVPEEEA